MYVGLRDIKIPMSLCWKCGWMFGNKPLKITKWGHLGIFKG